MPGFPSSLDDVILVTHAGCLDGSACALVFITFGGRMKNVRFVAAGMAERFIKDDPVMSSSSFVIFADVGLNSPKYADVLEKRGNVVFLDHHSTSNHMHDRPWAEIDVMNTRCGALMLLDFLKSKTAAAASTDPQSFSWKLDHVRKLVVSVDDFDRWVRNDPVGDDLSLLHVFYGQRSFIKLMTENPIPHVMYDSSQLIETLRQRRDEGIGDAVKRAFVHTLTDPETGRSYQAAVAVSSDPNISQLLARLLSEFPACDLAVQVNLDRRQSSFRSRDGGPNVAAICASLGGGGHVHASGHRLQGSIHKEIARLIYG